MRIVAAGLLLCPFSIQGSDDGVHVPSIRLYRIHRPCKKHLLFCLHSYDRDLTETSAEPIETAIIPRAANANDRHASFTLLVGTTGSGGRL